MVDPDSVAPLEGIRTLVVVGTMPFSIRVCSVPLPLSPTAVQTDEPLQDTPSNKLVGEAFGLVTIDQADPFQDSINVCSLADPSLLAKR
jgi:hypothetical protein